MKNREWKKKDKAKGEKIKHKKSALKNNEVGKKASKSYCKTQLWKFKMKYILCFLTITIEIVKLTSWKILGWKNIVECMFHMGIQTRDNR